MTGIGAPAQPPRWTPDAPEGYADLTRIDQGGFATVYRARDLRFDRTVALKVLRSDNLSSRQLRRFRAECLATGRASTHPNIVTVYDAGTTSGNRPWLAMEYCSGGSLAHKVATQGPLPIEDVISIGAGLCSALGAAHEAGILHRDVKPANVRLTSYGEPALADFGIASVAVADETATETAAYTVVHAAPEILEGHEGTAAADIYSLGSTLYTLLAGHAPYATEASTGLGPLVTRILQGEVPVIDRPGVPRELEQLLRTSMAAQPQDRPTCAELGAALTRVGQRLTSGGLDAGFSPVSARRLILVVGGALGLLLAAFTAWGPSLGAPRSGTHPPSAAGSLADAAGAYAPRDVVVTPGTRKGELVVSWTMPVRPGVVATVIYEGTSPARARAIVSYTNNPGVVPRETLRGLPSGQEVCLSAAHVVSLGDVVTDAVDRAVCAKPR